MKTFLGLMRSYWGNAKGVVVSNEHDGGQIFSSHSSQATLGIKDGESSRTNKTKYQTQGKYLCVVTPDYTELLIKISTGTRRSANPVV